MMGGLLSAAHSRQAPRISSDIICRSSAVSAYQESSSGIVGSSWCSSRRPLALPCSVTISSYDVPLIINGLTSSSVTGQKQKMEVSAPANATTNAFDMAAMASRAVREPWIVVQTTREVDILDDVYRWCKYRDCRWQTGMPWLLTSSSWAGCLRVLRKFRCK
ncbi:probable WRKY transcription factor 3 isoform X3 [Panicum hallii]|uniref:probable WRKY transcription factor 3 isoform X3 n=1 Tax=Panicum hallii TaxID=206008 RepID=UPI000DF4DE5A|nr:probable WRKY transcription factor 3 isoform X3 [Panicum hallii]